jgi:glycosyltransferase involved in cell wall biosynthesis
LSEFIPICHHNGQMVRTETYELCRAASPTRCHECFPTIPLQTFFLRERFVKSAFAAVDLFIAPSETVRRRYVEWGISPKRIRYERNGRTPATPLPDPPSAGRRKRIGFFGQITPYKGVDVLLEAMKLLEQRGAGVQLLLRGANLEHQRTEFQDRIHELLEHTSGSVRVSGRYERAQLAALLSAVDWVVVPSIWWENAPLVIQEAMAHRRPVICSDVGGMAESVEDGVDGLHFAVGDPHSLADTIERAASDPALWDEICSRIKEPRPMHDYLAMLMGTYDELLERIGSRSAAAA